MKKLTLTAALPDSGSGESAPQPGQGFPWFQGGPRLVRGAAAASTASRKNGSYPRVPMDAIGNGQHCTAGARQTLVERPCFLHQNGPRPR